MDEVQIWLNSINRRLTGRRSWRRPFYAQIHRTIPRAFFDYSCETLLAGYVKCSDGFATPFCYHSKNRKVEVISLTSIRLVKELFCLFSGFQGPEVMALLKRRLTAGLRSFRVSWRSEGLCLLFRSKAKENLLSVTTMGNGTSVVPLNIISTNRLIN